MRILLVNDDGMDAKGIRALVRALSPEHQLLVVAPETERSGFSHALTYYNKIYVRQHELEGGIPAYSISGTPADCTKMGVRLFAGGPLDLVISGINNGANLGTDICYSGTFAAAAEGAMQGVRSLAVSQIYHERGIEPDYTYAAEYMAGFVRGIDGLQVGRDVILNINFPDVEQGVRGIRITEQSTLDYGESYTLVEKKADGRLSYILQGTLKPDENVKGDAYAVARGYISITPMRFNSTDKVSMVYLQDLEG